ncbi:MAG TPA: hypothetical protein VEV64_01745, partial [Rhizomicrobium sp.]|nr:hypothetical protein [Rhizomicrobium sp.]
MPALILLPLGFVAVAAAQNAAAPKPGVPPPADQPPADAAPSPPPPPPQGGTQLIMRGLDKITGRPTSITAPIGKQVNFATLTIT